VNFVWRKRSAGDEGRAVRGGERLADARLEVVPPLIRGVDAPEARAERELDEAGVRSSFQAVP